MTYVCPQQASKVDQALTKNQETQDEFDTICRTPPEQRTAKQQQLIGAVGPDACANHTGGVADQ